MKVVTNEWNPQTLEAAKEKRYGRWAGNKRGDPYKEGKCAYEVWDHVSRQCSRKKGHGVNGLYCKQHEKKVVSDGR